MLAVYVVFAVWHSAEDKEEHFHTVVLGILIIVLIVVIALLAC